VKARLSLAATSSPAGDPERDASRRLAGLLLELARCVNPSLAASHPGRLEADPQLDALRDVLLEREQAALARLQQKFDDPGEFAAAVGAVLPAAFELAASQDERLGQVLAPTVERAAQASIRKNPGTMVDILYPVMGAAIRKAMAETLDGTIQSLNQALKHSLSWRGLKWRVEAWRSNSTFADVVLKHTAVFRVEHLFLIHRKAGLLLAHVAGEDTPTQDPQLVSAMLSAIQDFVRDSFGDSSGGVAEGRSIDSLRLGDLLLWCEEGPQAFLAAVIQGNPPAELRARLRETLVAIHEECRSALDEFDGDTAPFDEVAQRLQPCLMQQVAVATRQDSPLLWAVPLALVAALGYWIAQRTIERNRVDAYVEALREQPGIVVASALRRDGRWEVSGLRDPLAANPAALLQRANLDASRVVGHWEPYQALHPAIVLKRLQATLNPPPTVTLSQDANGIHVGGSAPQHWADKARAYMLAMPAGAPRLDLSTLKDVQDADYVRLRSAIESHVIRFEQNDPRPMADQEPVLDGVASELRDLVRVARGLGFSVRVMIVGHADATGKDIPNMALSLGRAEVVRSMLRSRGIDPAWLDVRGAGPLEPLKPGASEDDLSMNRRVSFAVRTSD
jgi:OOP family OmpA-OmpF porin